MPHILNLSVQDVKGTVFQQALSERGRLRLGQIRLLVRRAPLPGGVCRQPGPPQRPVLLADQPEPSNHRRRIHGFLAAFDRCYRGLTKPNAKGELTMKRELEPYQLIERSIIKKFRKELWTPSLWPSSAMS